MIYEQVKENYLIDLQNMEHEEAEDIIEYDKRFGRKTTCPTAILEARARIERWIRNANEERVSLDFKRLACFVASSRRTKAWATFIGLAKLEDENE